MSDSASTSPTSAKPLEPGVVPGNPPSNGLPAQVVNGPAGWTPLPAKQAPNFTSAKAVALPAGTTLYRVFGYPSEADAWASWEISAWWTQSPIPATEAEWRSSLAVEASWNGGQFSESWVIPSEIKAWEGPATLQSGEYADGSPAPGCYLPGGMVQLYLNPVDMPAGKFSPNFSPWTPQPGSTAAAKPAPEVTVPDDVSHETLAEAVNNLVAVLKKMETEGAAKGQAVKGLRVQAARLGKAATDLASLAGEDNLPVRKAIAQGLAGVGRHVTTEQPWSDLTGEADQALHHVVAQASHLTLNT